MLIQTPVFDEMHTKGSQHGHVSMYITTMMSSGQQAAMSVLITQQYRSMGCCQKWKCARHFVHMMQ